MPQTPSRSLFLLRHAKSSWAEDDMEDFDRPLAPRGRNATPRMGALMRDRGFVPDLVVCSPARRARETFTLLMSALDEPTVQWEDALYMASPETLLACLRGLPDVRRRVLLIGHNPGIGVLAASLVGAGDQLPRLQRKFPTAGLAVLRFDTRWAEVDYRAGRLEAFVTPADLD